MPATKTKKTTTPQFDPLTEGAGTTTPATNGDTPTPKPPKPPELDLIEIPFRGTTFTIPKSRDEWNTDGYLAFMEAIDQNAYPPYIRAAKLLLGPTQWARLQAMGTAGRPAATRKDFDEFLAVFLPKALEDCVN